jgi:hypothetical protein
MTMFEGKDETVAAAREKASSFTDHLFVSGGMGGNIFCCTKGRKRKEGSVEVKAAVEEARFDSTRDTTFFISFLFHIALAKDNSYNSHNRSCLGYQEKS